MEKKEQENVKKRFLRVRDKDGNEYVCRIEDLKPLEALTEEEKKACFGVPTHGPGE